MTAVASPIQFQPPSRTGWNTFSGGQSGLGAMSSDDVGRMLMPGPRKSAQRTNSNASLNSQVSMASTITASSAPTNGNTPITADGWATRKKTNRGIWPPGKSEPTAGISAARPQAISSASSGPTAASAISALHAPLLSTQQMANGQAQQNGTVRNGTQNDTPAFLYLSPMNGTFERKTINVPTYPDVLRVGRQTNAKTAPTPANGYFDSKVLSRSHAEVYAERNGRVFIRDVKSSNGTFVNGKRLSPENKESEPCELREQDVLELGIDIVSEDQKTVVHHKVAARVEHAGAYAQNGEINFGELDPSGGGFMAAQQMKRTGSQQSIQGAKANALAAAAMAARDANGGQQQGWSRMWLQPISTEHIVKRLNRELSLARQQSQDLARAKQCIEVLMKGEEKSSDRDSISLSDKPNRPSSMKKAHFSEPPAPPPQQPLPEKPDVAKALADPVIQPLLHRSDTARPTGLGNGSPTRPDHSQALLILTHELKMAKDQIPSLVDRVKTLEQQLMAEKTARESAEDRAQRLEIATRKDSAEPNGRDESFSGKDGPHDQTSQDQARTVKGHTPDLEAQLDRLRTSMDEMKQQMEAYRRRAETAETERDETRQTLAEMIESRRKENAEGQSAKRSRSRSKQDHDQGNFSGSLAMNGHSTADDADGEVATAMLLEKAGVDMGKPITKQQAVALQRLLSQDVLGSERAGGPTQWGQISHQGAPYACAFTTVMLGLALMQYLNGWEKIQR